jgi:tetratricopeptide (TPR) repeat protein
MRSVLLSRMIKPFAAVLSKRAAVVVGLAGEAGIGKSFMARAMLREIPCGHLSVVTDASLEGLLLVLPRPKLPGWVGLQLERVIAGEVLEPEAWLVAVMAVLSALAPFVLHLEDVQVNSEHFELVLRLARAISRARGVGLIATGRVPLLEPFVSHVLEGLEISELQVMLEAELGSSLPAEALAWVHGRTRGNPLFAFEFVRYLVRQGFLWHDAQRWLWRSPHEQGLWRSPHGQGLWRSPSDRFVPVTVEALVAQAILSQAFDPDLMAVLEARSVLSSEPVSLEVWAKVAVVNGSGLKAAIGSLERVGLLSGLGFTHPLFQEVVFAGLSRSRKSEFATRALRALEPADPVMAAGFLDLAALSPAEALDLLDRAIACASTVTKGRLLGQRVRWTAESERGPVAFAAARSLWPFEPSVAATLAEQAVALLPDDPNVLALLCEVRIAQRRFEEAETLLHRLEPSAIWWRLLLRFRHASGDFVGAIRAWRGHVRFQVGADVGVLQSLAWSLLEVDGQAGALEASSLIASYLARDLPVHDFPVHDRIVLLSTQGKLMLRLNQLEQAEQVFVQALEFAPSLEARDLRDLHHHLSEVYYIQDRYPQSIKHLELALEFARRYGDALELAQLQTRLGLLRLETGEYEQAQTLLQNTLDALEGHPSPALCDVNLLLCVLHLSWPTPYGALLAQRYARHSLEVARSLGVRAYLEKALFVAVQAEVVANDLRGARTLVDELEALMVPGSLPGSQARVSWALGRVLEAEGQLERALERYRWANALFTELQDQSLIRQSQLEVDRLTHHLEGAREHLAWFRDHGLERLAQVVERAFPELAAPPEITPAIRVYLRVLGTVQLECDGQVIRSRARKRLEVLALLLEARISGKEVTTLDLLDALAPNQPELEAKATLKQHVYLLRLSLGADVIVSTANGYALGAVSSDAEEFLRSGETRLWHGPYLEGLGSGWLPNVRDALTFGLRDSLKAVSDPDEVGRLESILRALETSLPE